MMVLRKSLRKSSKTVANLNERLLRKTLLFIFLEAEGWIT